MATNKNKSKSKKSSTKSARKPARKPSPKRTTASKAKSKPKAPPLRKRAKKPAATKKASPLRKAVHEPVHKTPPEVHYLLTDSSVSVTFPGKKNGKPSLRTKTLRKGTPAFERAIAAIRSKDNQGLVEVMLHAETIVQKNIDRFPDRGVELRDGGVYIDKKQLPPELSNRIVAYANEGIPYDSLIKFWRKLVKNPSFRAVRGLFRFLSANHFPITDYGNFLAYKGVRADWTDCHSGKMDNSIGKTVKMFRNEVDEDPAQACSRGLHVASYNYAHTGYGGGHGEGGHTIVVSVDPADVVAVPYADRDEKMRVCRYIVIAESTGELAAQRVDEDNLPQAPAVSSGCAANDTDDAMGPVGDNDEDEEEDHPEDFDPDDDDDDEDEDRPSYEDQ